MTTGAETLSADEQRLAELGYKQELHRGWSSFSNFAISFSIISVLAGCFTTYGQALQQRRADRDLDHVADHLRPDPRRRRLPDVGAGVGVPDLGRHLLLGLEARRRRLGLVHRLVQPDRPGRRRRVGRLRLRELPHLPARPLQPRLRVQLRGSAEPRHYTAHVEFAMFAGDPHHSRAAQRVLEPPRVGVQRTSRCGGT